MHEVTQEREGSPDSRLKNAVAVHWAAQVPLPCRRRCSHKAKMSFRPESHNGGGFVDVWTGLEEPERRSHQQFRGRPIHPPHKALWQKRAPREHEGVSLIIDDVVAHSAPPHVVVWLEVRPCVTRNVVQVSSIHDR